MRISEVVAAAMVLAGNGIATFPCYRNKHPATPRGYLDATRDSVAIRKLWRDYPAPLIGVATGAASGLDVLDLDLPRHPEARDWWQANRHRIPPTRVHETRSGGLHLLFRAALGLRCSAAKIALGVDVRSNGGSAVWWPAAGFRVLRALDPAPWPDWLLAELQPPSPPPLRSVVPPPGSNAARRYGLAALRRAVERVATAGEGTRNSRLNAETFALSRLVCEGALSAAELADSLAIAARYAGLSPRETVATIASALRAGGAA